MRTPQTLVLALAASLCGASALPAQEPAAPLRLERALVRARPAQAYRAALHVDPVEHALVMGSWSAPEEGEEWRALEARENGWFNDGALGNGYLHLRWEEDSARPALVRVRGADLFYLNGEIRVGDRYATGWTRLPAQLAAGTNELLLLCHRGRAMVEIEPIRAHPFLWTVEPLLPELVADGNSGEAWGSVLVGLGEHMGRVGTLALRARTEGGVARVPALKETRAPELAAPDMLMEVPFRIAHGPLDEAGSLPLRVELVRSEHRNLAAAEVLDTWELELNVREPGQARRVTFESGIDGSIQTYSVRPASPQLDDAERPGILLSLHGAGVQAHSQVGSISAKPWAHVVAATNRRPFGFDWEDWGRLDALEVLAHAARTHEHDPRRVWLSGHSMGGHGTLQLGALFPSKWAAIGPSAGWVDFWSYGGAAEFEADDAMGELFARAACTSRTLDHKYNYASLAVYLLHGDADNNVPPTHARRMAEVLGEFHDDWRAYEEPGVGHWWNRSPEPGADCVDWAPMLDLFARRSRPTAQGVRRLDFTTSNPWITADHHWLRVEAQERRLRPSRVSLDYAPLSGRLSGVTSNVTRFSVAPPQPGVSSITLELDGQEPLTIELDGSGAQRVGVELTEAGWRACEPRAPRPGPFKTVFDRDVGLVVPSANSEGSAEAWRRARYDAETFWYRGNGQFDFVLDSRVGETEHAQRNLVLYGNAALNRAWDGLLADCPVRVEPGRVRVGEAVYEGEDLACLLTWPREGVAGGQVGAVAWTGAVGERLSQRLPYFVTGHGYPDFCVLDPSSLLEDGTAGVLAAGYFEEDGSLGEDALLLPGRGR